MGNKKRKSKIKTSYLQMSLGAAQERLGIRLEDIKAVAPSKMLVASTHNVKKLDKLKGKVYKRIVEFLSVEGYPEEATLYFKEANVNDLVYSIISPVIHFMQQETGHKLRLTREKEIASIDDLTGGQEEFVLLDYITVTEERYLLIIEAKKSSIGVGMKQILLALKDAWDNNRKCGYVHGFVTTGVDWRWIRYDGESFVKSDDMRVLFNRMKEDKLGWITEYSGLINCILSALTEVTKDTVVRI